MYRLQKPVAEPFVFFGPELLVFLVGRKSISLCHRDLSEPALAAGIELIDFGCEVELVERVLELLKSLPVANFIAPANIVSKNATTGETTKAMNLNTKNRKAKNRISGSQAITNLKKFPRVLINTEVKLEKSFRFDFVFLIAFLELMVNTPNVI